MQRGPTSMEGHRHGPSSVEAVRRGEIGFAFDSYYVIDHIHHNFSFHHVYRLTNFHFIMQFLVVHRS